MDYTTITVGAAVSVALFHTLAGPDHYVPFVALARSRGWSHGKLVAITTVSGLAHVSSSILLGLAAALLGAAFASVEQIRELAGSAAGYGLVALGAVYAAWGLWRTLNGRPHSHAHFHRDGTLHYHRHGHAALPVLAALPHHHAPEMHEALVGSAATAGCDSTDSNTQERGPSSTPAWILFLIFAFGPCEPLIALSFPLGLARAWAQLAWVSAVFSAVTIATMVAVVLVAHAGLSRLHFPRLQKYVHVLSGLAIFACGGAIVWLGL